MTFLFKIVTKKSNENLNDYDNYLGQCYHLKKIYFFLSCIQYNIKINLPG